MNNRTNINNDFYFNFVNELPLCGDDIVIKQINVAELMYIKKNNDFDQYLMSCRPVFNRTEDESKEIFKKLITNDKNLLLGIFYYDDILEREELVGRISFYDLNTRNRSVELGYLLSNKYQGKGIMSKALKKVIFDMFNKTQLNKIYAQTAVFNKKSIKLLEKCGFTLDGTLREHHEYNGKLYDDLIYSILKDK